MAVFNSTVSNLLPGMKNVINILTNESTVTDKLGDGVNGVYIGKAARNATAPYIVIVERLLQAYVGDQGTTSTGGDYEYLVMCFADNYLSVRNLADSVNGILDRNKGNVTGGHTLQDIRLESDETDAIEEENENFYMIELRYIGFITK